MDLTTVVFTSFVVLVTAGADQPFQTTELNMTEPTKTSTSIPPATSVGETSTTASFFPGLLMVNWTKECKGIVYLMPYLSIDGPSLPVCQNHDENIQIILKDMCKNRKYCQHVDDSSSGTGKGEVSEGYNKTESGAWERISCEPHSVPCAAEDPTDKDRLQRQLQVYEVVIALLCCVLLILLLIRFTPPTVAALQSRLSEKRRDRWIGPTQSHSVSYHRGKAAVRSNEGEKRLSYPALERLTIRDSGDLSSNRNSGYDF